MSKRLWTMALGLFLSGRAMALQPGDPAPLFQVPATDGTVFDLAKHRGEWIALYFYPKAFTPGCTTEGCSLRDGYSALRERGVAVYGISLDSMEKLKSFKAEHHFPFELLSDENKTVAKAYGVLGVGGLFAKRVTFLINPEGRIERILDKVEPARHDRQILEALPDATDAPASPGQQ